MTGSRWGAGFSSVARFVAEIEALGLRFRRVEQTPHATAEVGGLRQVDVYQGRGEGDEERGISFFIAR